MAVESLLSPLQPYKVITKQNTAGKMENLPDITPILFFKNRFHNSIKHKNPVFYFPKYGLALHSMKGASDQIFIQSALAALWQPGQDNCESESS